MNQEIAHNLFSNFQSTVYKAVKAFLQKNKREEIGKQITTSLRIPSEIKEFYECLSEAEMTSFNTVIVNTLSKVKDYTVTEYQKSYTKINDAYDYQINSFLKIIDDSKIDYNDLCALFEWITGNKVTRADVTNKEKLINIIDKNAQLKFCKVFGYNYQWIQDNKRCIYYQGSVVQYRWYKNVPSFIQDLIIDFYLDETVESFELSFLCCDRNIVTNIISRVIPMEEESITPIVIANRSINGIKLRTYHRFESNNINYEKCRNHFVVLIKMIFMLRRHAVIDFPCGYLVTPQQHDMIRDGSMHLVELFNKNYLSNEIYLDDLEDIKLYSFLPDDNNKTDTPNIYHSLNWLVLHKILDWSDKNSSSIVLTDELASKVDMGKAALTKYLMLFDKNKPSSNGIFILSEDKNTVIINLDRLRELQSEFKNCLVLDTSFG